MESKPPSPWMGHPLSCPGTGATQVWGLTYSETNGKWLEESGLVGMDFLRPENVIRIDDNFLDYLPPAKLIPNIDCTYLSTMGSIYEKH
jgi:hypothetical protein